MKRAAPELSGVLGGVGSGRSVVLALNAASPAPCVITAAATSAHSLPAEDKVLLRALRDFNLGKLTADDTSIFMGLLGDLFPKTVEHVPRAVDVSFEAKVGGPRWGGWLQGGAESLFSLFAWQGGHLITPSSPTDQRGGAGAGLPARPHLLPQGVAAARDF